MITRLLQRWLIIAVTFALVVLVLPGIDIHWSPFTFLGLAAVFGILNATLGRILRLLSLPVMILTLGLFALVINVVLLYVTSWFTGLDIDSLGAAIGASVLISAVSLFLNHRDRHDDD
jgi:putative membrane protein